MIQEHVFHKIKQEILRANKPVFVIHKKPDGDTLGSGLALLYWMRSLGREPGLFCRDQAPENYQFLPSADEIITEKSIFQQADLVVVLDSGDLGYAGVEDIFSRLQAKPSIINIDHHMTNQQYGDINLIDSDASSTAELIYEFFVKNKIGIDKKIATALLVGVLTDTGNFTNPATTFGSLQVASELVRLGARTHEISKNLLKNKPVDALRLWGRMLARLEENKKFNMAYTIIKQEDIDEISSPAEAVEGAANFLNRLLNVDLVLVLQENSDGTIKGSIRSTNVDVSQIAEALGGGGHKRAAGFTIKGRLEKDGEHWQVI